ncbi:MAG: hypothetical protein ACLQDY_31120 [Streptosporangiaceae bacterium]
MGLRARQRRILEATERGLLASDPHLAALFTFFTRLNRDEEMPRIEEIRYWVTSATGAVRRRLGAIGGWLCLRLRLGPRARTALFFPLALALIAASFAISPRHASASPCGRRAAATEPARQRALDAACGLETSEQVPVGK